MSSIEDELTKLSISEESPKTGVVFDDRMSDHRCLWDANHIERPERYLLSLQRCRDYDLIGKCKRIPARYADESEIMLLHDRQYVEDVKSTKNMSAVDLEKFASRYDSVYFHPKTYDSALLAAGSCLELVSAILSDKIKNGFAIVRPPGHHAMAGEACGFCYFNNAAITAKYALERYHLKKILIIDWDVHHGQGTQQFFYDDPRVLYFSMHRYEEGVFWPNLRESNYNATGDPNARGFNINVPLNTPGLGNTEYLNIFFNILLPVAFEFNPELVIISAGFDAAIGCPEGEMKVAPAAFAHFISLLSCLAGGKICVLFEGGYCLSSLSESAALTLRSLLGFPCPSIHETSDIHSNLVDTVLGVIAYQRPFWMSLRIQNLHDPENEFTRKHTVNLKEVTDPEKPDSYPTRECYPVPEPKVIESNEAVIKKLIAENDLSIPECKTCLVFDREMTKHENKREKHHPEKGDRIICIYEELRNSGLLSKCLLLESREASITELSLVHDQEYISLMESTSAMENRDIAKLEMDYESVYLCRDTYKSARLACGSLLQIVDAVMAKKCVNGFAIIRPPGHHADVKEAQGFCIFNSVAIAAQHLVENYKLKRILIVDWDIHHGNGTQNIFYKDNKVLFISLHLHDGNFFPGLPEACEAAVGKGEGKGYTINIPWQTLVGDGDYLSAFFHVVLPVAYEYNPEFVLVSAGFDAAENDPLGGCHVTPACFGVMTKLLSGLCNGRVVLALEGGYNLEKTSQAAVQCINSLLDEFSLPLKPATPSPSAISSIRNVVKVHKRYWKCLRFDTELPDLTPSMEIPLVLENGDNNCEGADSMFGGMTLFCVTPLDYCPHLELLRPYPAEGLNPFACCEECGDYNENWVCLQCYSVQCGRFVNGHMLQHSKETNHQLTLSYSDLSVWCYACDSYVHNEVLMPVKDHAQLRKFA